MRHRLSLLAMLILFAFSCKDHYLPSVIDSNKNYLVVDGFIDVGANSVTRIRITRTTNVNDTASINAEKNATVTIEQGGTLYPLTESDSGYYVSGALKLSQTTICHLNIKTSDNAVYKTDDILPKISPEIDSINFASSHDGVQLYVTSHDNKNKTLYYRWDYEETWEYNPPHRPLVTYDWSKKMLSPLTTSQSDSLFRCFQTQASTTIEVATSEALGQDIISNYPIAYIPPASIKLSVLYSLQVKQYALTEPAYNYFANVKKITEQLGNVFGPLPSEVKGNIHNVASKSEIVIGYVVASTVTKNRIFIHDFPNWKYAFSDNDLRKGVAQVEGADVPLSVQSIYYLETSSPCPADPNEPACTETYGACCPKAVPFSLSGTTMQYGYTTACIDCIYWGKQGTRTKPSFWPR